MSKKNSLVCFLFIFSVYCQMSVAATTLFDPNRGKPIPPRPAAPKAKPIKKNAPVINYRLVGISSLSSIYHVTFQDTKNKKFKKIKWKKDNTEGDSPVSGFHLKLVDNRRVILQANNENQYNCKENPTNRITCGIDEIEMIFALVTNKPTQSVKPILNNAAANKKNKQLRKKPSSKNPFKLQ